MGERRLEAIVADRGTPQKHVWRRQEWFMAEGVDGLLRAETHPPDEPPIALGLVACSSSWWRTSRTARSRSSAGDAVDRVILLVMNPILPKVGPPVNPVRFTIVGIRSWEIATTDRMEGRTSASQRRHHAGNDAPLPTPEPCCRLSVGGARCGACSRARILDCVRAGLSVTAAELVSCRDAFLAGGEASLKNLRRADYRDANIAPLEGELGDMIVATALLGEDIEKSPPVTGAASIAWGTRRSGTDIAATLTGAGNAAIFALVDHCSGERLGLHAAERGTCFEALVLLRQATPRPGGGTSDPEGGAVRKTAQGITASVPTPPASPAVLGCGRITAAGLSPTISSTSSTYSAMRTGPPSSASLRARGEPNVSSAF